MERQRPRIANKTLKNYVKDTQALISRLTIKLKQSNSIVQTKEQAKSVTEQNIKPKNRATPIE